MSCNGFSGELKWEMLTIAPKYLPPLFSFYPLRFLSFSFPFPEILAPVGPRLYFSPFSYVVWKQSKRTQVWSWPIIPCLCPLILKACSQKYWTTPASSQPHRRHDRAEAWPIGLTLSLCFLAVLPTYNPPVITLYNDNRKTITSKGTACVVSNPQGVWWHVTHSLTENPEQLSMPCWHSFPEHQTTCKQCHSSLHRYLGMINVTRNDTVDYFPASLEFTWWENSLTRMETCSETSQTLLKVIRRVQLSNPETFFSGSAWLTCLRSRVIVTQWYSLPFWILGLCHQLLVPSIAFDIGWRSVKRKHTWVPLSSCFQVFDFPAARLVAIRSREGEHNVRDS